MTKVDENRLKGNYAAAYVTSRLASKCLVRTVSGDTDVGIDLYCETVQEGLPFIHYWLQVKSGNQCKVSKDRSYASCTFDIQHLLYWSRQPVPVFVALVPVDWPVEQDPDIYIVDLTLKNLEWEIPNTQDSVTYKSDYRWAAGDRNAVEYFLYNIVPADAARLEFKKGVIGSVPTLDVQYEQQIPVHSVLRFLPNILDQMRRTAAFTISHLMSLNQLDRVNAEDRQTLELIVEAYKDSPNWENFAARSFCAYADGDLERAVELCKQAISTIEKDQNVAHKPEWKQRALVLKIFAEDCTFQMNTQSS